jgi:hypothetical protein
MESSCEFGIEPLGFIKRWEAIECPSGVLSGAQLQRVSYMFSEKISFLNCDVQLVTPTYIY